MKLHAVIIHDQPPLRNLIAMMLQAWTANDVRIEQTGFDTRLSGVWQRWLHEMDLFVVGLERRYEKGFRAEGVTVADTLWRAGRKVLIIGLECSADQLASPFYWDVGSEQPLLNAVAEVLERSLPGPNERARLQKHFEKQLKIPTGH